MAFLAVEDGIEEIRKGNILIVTDDEARENEGDFIMAAEKITPEAINFMTKYGRGLVCVPMTGERLQQLRIGAMVDENTALLGTRFMVSVDAVRGTSTGISAYDRAVTIRALADPNTRPEDLARPGHIFPLCAVQGGVLRRAGHTEAVVDIARMAGFEAVGVLCEIMDEDGSMARIPRLMGIAQEWNLGMVTIEELIAYRHRTEKLVKKELVTKMPTTCGDFNLHCYTSVLDDEVHLALVKGEVNTEEPVLVRVHSQCLTGDIFHSLRCDCGAQLHEAMHLIEEAGRGVLLYMRQEGRGIGLKNKLRAYVLQEQGLDTVEANLELGFKDDHRDYGVGAQILADLGLKQIRLMTNNPRKLIGLDGYGLKIVERVPILVGQHEHNRDYLKAKREKMGHLL